MFGWGSRKESRGAQGQEGFGDEQAEVHTPGRPYCDDLSCWCHTDVAYHDQVTGSFSQVTADQVEQAYWFLQIQDR